MANEFPPLIISDNEIARLALKYWPEPTKYQATVMTTIALMESGGDARAWYYNTEGLFAESFDRGLWGINECAIEEVFGEYQHPPSFADPESNAIFAYHIWYYRYSRTLEKNPSISNALVYAYSGWTTYRKARIEKDPDYVKAWNILNARAIKATGWKA